jgi:hypothetical protein
MLLFPPQSGRCPNHYQHANLNDLGELYNYLPTHLNIERDFHFSYKKRETSFTEFGRFRTTHLLSKLLVIQKCSKLWTSCKVI